MISMFLRFAAAFDATVGLRCPLLWAYSRTYRTAVVKAELR